MSKVLRINVVIVMLFLYSFSVYANDIVIEKEFDVVVSYFDDVEGMGKELRHGMYRRDSDGKVYVSTDDGESWARIENENIEKLLEQISLVSYNNFDLKCYENFPTA